MINRIGNVGDPPSSVSEIEYEGDEGIVQPKFGCAMAMAFVFVAAMLCHTAIEITKIIWGT